MSANAAHELRVYMNLWSKKNIIDRKADRATLMDAYGAMAANLSAVLGELSMLDCDEDSDRALLDAGDRASHFRDQLTEGMQRFIRQFPRSER